MGMRGKSKGNSNFLDKRSALLPQWYSILQFRSWKGQAIAGLGSPRHPGGIAAQATRCLMLA
jgi:hypothetical protein